MRLVVQICVVLLLVSFSSPQQQPTFRTQTNLVVVPVLVEDARGHAVYGLRAQDFVVEDQGVAQPIRMSEADESQPLAIVVAIQRGRSARFEYARMNGLNTMLDPILSSQRAKIAIVEFDNDIQLARDFTNDDVVIAADLRRILGQQLGRWTPQPGEGGAPILDAVNYSLRLLAKVPNRQRVLLLISETRDHGSHFTKVEDILAAIGNTNATVFALTFSPSKTNVLDTLRGNNNDRWQPVPDLLYPVQEVAQGFRKNAAKEITSLTGGEYAEFSSHKAFDARLNDFTNHLHNRYLLNFTPKEPHPGLHHLHVSVSGSKGWRVVSRSSYWAIGS